MEIRVFNRLSDVSRAHWDDLHCGRDPFVSHAFLAGLEAHGCLREDWGWSPLHLTVWDGDTLIAAAPGYVKTNSHGEFVFDHAWARAYAEYGRDYFPKWLCAVPYSPVTGPRLLARDAASRIVLLDAMRTLVRQHGWSSAHANFHLEEESTAFDAPVFGGEWRSRIDVQYHWRNEAGWANFDAFLAAMDHKHRKNIRQERAKVAKAGVEIRIVHGDEASEADLAAMHRFYLRTFADYGNSPALTLAFLRHLARAMPRALVLFLAEQAGDTIAGALCLRGGDTLYGRYWGATRVVPGLHFETCYYQGIDYCLREGLRRFEPGAQGEHKIDRGFLPTFVRSRHWIADPDFSAALGRWCEEEAAAVRAFERELQARSPFRARLVDETCPRPERAAAP
ncbi:MAG: N-acetyltransferase [Lysobacter sp.]|nr:MAG: N-acetyltransferase [Lysobacter sp.]